jgi:putative nucleotidyltransferase with HDIG domain
MIEMLYPDTVKDTLNRIVSMVGDLPAAPAVVSAAMVMTADLQSNVTDVSRTLSLDQSLTAKVLKLSNSPYYGRRKEVETLNEAIMVLGFGAVRSLVVAASSHGMFVSDDSDDAGCKLWRHSLSTAIAGRQIAAKIGYRDSEEVFIAALMHDVGKLVMLEKLPDWYAKIIEEVEQIHDSFRRVESRVLRFNHCDVASVLLADWSFPKNLISAISSHHRPSSNEDGDAVVSTAQIINLANYMAKNLGVGFDDKHVERLSKLKSAQAMQLDDDALGELFEEVREQYQIEIRILEGDPSATG